MAKKNAVKEKGVKILNNGVRIFRIPGEDLLEGGKREVVGMGGKEVGIIGPGETVTVTASKAKILEKGFKKEILVWGRDQKRGK